MDKQTFAHVVRYTHLIDDFSNKKRLREGL